MVWNRAGWKRFEDTDYTRLREKFEKLGFEPVSKEMMRDAVARVASMNTFDSAQDWLRGECKWDGVRRIETFLTRYFSAENTPYSRSVSLYLWTALAGRVESPGCQADMVPVLVGGQGVGKSRGVRAIAPSEENFAIIDLLSRDADQSRKLRGKLVVEFGELRGLHSRDMESVKEFISRTHEHWVPKYQEHATIYARRCVFIGTTNQEEFLADTTGNRRWLPVKVGHVDVEGIDRDRELLWAEAREMYAVAGILWADAQALGAESHQEHRLNDGWAEEIEEWLSQPSDVEGSSPESRGAFRMREVVVGALRMEVNKIKRNEEHRIAAILREFGFTRKMVKKDGCSARMWVKK